ncbi:MAG: FliI/YscN family ATPase [candidate division FCPU426 bacterium]
MSKILKAPSVSAEERLVPVGGAWRLAGHEAGSAAQAAPAEAVEAAASARAREKEAFARGLRAGREEARAAACAEDEAVRAVLQRLEDELAGYCRRIEIKAGDLVAAMVRRIVGAAGGLSPEVIQHNLRKLLSKPHAPGEMLTVRLHPEDYRRLAPQGETALKNLKLQPDPEVERGGCLMESQFGLLDARLDTQLEELEGALRAQLAAGHSLTQAAAGVEGTPEVRAEGRVTKIVGTVIESQGPNVTVGEQCDIAHPADGSLHAAEVIGFRDAQVLLMPLGDARGLGPGHRVIARGRPFTLQVGPKLLGRVINAMGQAIDGRGALEGSEAVSLHAQPNNPMQRLPVSAPLYTGIRAIDGLLTCAKGGRMGIFAGSGLGKSVLLGMMARRTQADVNVIALIGERGREVREFVERDLGEEGLPRSVVVAVTSDESPVLRIRGAQLAASLAEYFARQGRDVQFMMDSVTRFAMAQREVGLAAGEPPTTKGYPPSTFAALPKLLERSGNFADQGTITGFYTVLVEGDDHDEPVADHVRSILDGHIILSRALASQNHFPAIDVLRSISRLSKQVCSPEQMAWAGRVRDLLATYYEAQDLINIGAYVAGSNPQIDLALRAIGDLKRFLRQGLEESVQPEAMWGTLEDILNRLGG